MTEKNILVKVPIAPPTSGGTGGFTPGGPLEIGSTVITAEKKQIFSMYGGGGGYSAHTSYAQLMSKITDQLGLDPESQPGGMYWIGIMHPQLERQSKEVKARYDELLKNLEPSIKEEIETLKTTNPSPDNSSAGQLAHKTSLYNKLIAEKTTALQKEVAASNVFYGANPIGQDINQFARIAARIRRQGAAPDYNIFYERYKSLAAAYEAKLLEIQIAVLTAQAEDYKDAVSFLAATNEQILKKYGSNMSKISQDLQTNISGKKIRSYAEAMATFEKVKANPNIKLNAKDTQAVVDALSALDKATFADNVSRLGKAFGIAGKIVQADTIREKAVYGFKTGDWKPLMLEMEAMAIGTLAAAAAGAVLAAILGLISIPAVIAVPAVAILMALVASSIDASKADELNNLILKKFPL